MGKDTLRDCFGVIVDICLIIHHLMMSLYLIAPTKQISTTYHCSFCRVNFHQSIILFGCGVISHETIESYMWMLRTFSEAMI